jgi:hypothetical protein
VTRKRRRKKKSGTSYTRRAALLLVAGGSAAAVIRETQAFSVLEGDRASTVDVAADDGAALVKLQGFDPSKTYQEPHTVTVTNNTTSTLTNNSADANGADLELRDPGTSTSTTQYTIPTLTPGESVSFEIVTAGDETGIVSDTISLSFSNGGSVTVTADRDLTVEFKSGGQLVYAVGNGDIRIYDAVNDVENDPPNSNDADVIGANAADIVESADADIPYLSKGGGNKDIFATYVGASADVSIPKGTNPKLKKQKTRLTLAAWPPAALSGVLILAADKNTSKILAFDSDGNDEVVANPSNGCGGVSGVADIDGDGSDELVFIDSSQQMRYLEQNGTVVKIQNAAVGSNNSAGFGPPVDFNGDGVIRIPFIDGSQNPAVVTADGSKTILNSSGIAKKAAVAPVDIDGDGDPEFMFLGNSSGKIKYIDDVLGSNAVETLQVDGNPVTPLENVGLNSGTDTQPGSGGAPPQTPTPTPTPSGGCTVGSNNNPGALDFNKLQGFEAKAGPDRWDIGQIQVQDADGDDDLNELKFEITDGGSTVRATKTIQLSGQQYQKQNLQINPDNSRVRKNETYTLTATVCDSDGNSNTRTDAATA